MIVYEMLPVNVWRMPRPKAGGVAMRPTPESTWLEEAMDWCDGNGVPYTIRPMLGRHTTTAPPGTPLVYVEARAKMPAANVYIPWDPDYHNYVQAYLEDVLQRTGQLFAGMHMPGIRESSEWKVPAEMLAFNSAVLGLYSVWVERMALIQSYTHCWVDWTNTGGELERLMERYTDLAQCPIQHNALHQDIDEDWRVHRTVRTWPHGHAFQARGSAKHGSGPVLYAMAEALGAAHIELYRKQIDQL